MTNTDNLADAAEQAMREDGLAQLFRGPTEGGWMFARFGARSDCWVLTGKEYDHLNLRFSVSEYLGTDGTILERQRRLLLAAREHLEQALADLRRVLP